MNQPKVLVASEGHHFYVMKVMYGVSLNGKLTAGVRSGGDWAILVQLNVCFNCFTPCKWRQTSCIWGIQVRFNYL